MSLTPVRRGPNRARVGASSPRPLTLDEVNRRINLLQADYEVLQETNEALKAEHVALFERMAILDNLPASYPTPAETERTHHPVDLPGLRLLLWFFDPSRPEYGRTIIDQLFNRDQLSLAATCRSLRILVEPVLRLDMNIVNIFDQRQRGHNHLVYTGSNTIRKLKVNWFDEATISKPKAQWNLFCRHWGARLDMIGFSMTSLMEWPALAVTMALLPQVPWSVAISCFGTQPGYTVPNIAQQTYTDSVRAFLGQVRCLRLILHRYPGSPHGLWDVIGPFTGITSLTLSITNPPDDFAHEIARRFPHLQSLTIPYFGSNISLLIVPDQPLFGNLVVLALLCFNNEPSLHAVTRINPTDYPHLKNISLGRLTNPAFDGQHVEEYLNHFVGQSWPRLAKLLLYNWPLSSRTGSLITQNLHNLRHLTLVTCFRMLTVLPLIITQSQSLRSLALTFFSGKELIQFFGQTFYSETITSVYFKMQNCWLNIIKLKAQLPNLRDIRSMD
ncbi:hypothetical protein H4R33_005169, partial [Dimargaris cristalligena]